MFSFNSSHIIEHLALISAGYDGTISSHSIEFSSTAFINFYLPGSIWDTLTYVSEN